MSEQTAWDAAMREGERLEYFVETLTLARDGIEYEVPKVFYDDLMEKIGALEQSEQTIATLTSKLADAVAALQAMSKFDLTKTLEGKADDYPLFGLNGAMLTVGDVRKARAALLAAQEGG